MTGTTPRLRVVGLGRTRMLLNSIRLLAQAGHSIPLIATCRAAPEYDVRESDFAELAQEFGADFMVTQDLNDADVVARLRDAEADVAVSVNWVSLIGASVCGAFPFGILNAHAGDLPRFRGNAVVAWAILQAEPHVGVTIHQMDPDELDSGPILLKDFFPLTATTYCGEVFEFLERRIPDLFIAAVEGLALGTIEPSPQPAEPKLALRCYPRRPEDGEIDWKQSATQIGSLVRASSRPWSGAYSYYRDERVIVWRARAAAWPVPSLAIPGQVVSRDQESGEISVATGDGVLILEEVEKAGTATTAPVDLIRSLRDRLGPRASLLESKH